MSRFHAQKGGDAPGTRASPGLSPQKLKVTKGKKQLDNSSNNSPAKVSPLEACPSAALRLSRPLKMHYKVGAKFFE